MPKIKKKQITFLFIIAIIAIISGYIYLIFLPGEREIARLTSDQKNKEIQLSKAVLLARNQERLVKEIAELEDRVEQVKKELPKEKEIPQLLQRIDSTGRETNIDFLFFKPRPVVSKEFYGEVPIDLSVKGTFHDLGRFLNTIAGFPRLINMSRLKINSMNENDGKVTIKADMIAMTYIYMENIPVPVK